MRIRTITGDTLAQAMAKVREDLGPDAVILNIEDAKAKRGVVIRAAADSPDTIPAEVSGAPIESQLEFALRERLRTFQRTSGAHARIDPAISIAPALLHHRVPHAVTQRIIKWCGEANASDDLNALAHAFERTFSCGPLPLRPARPVLLLGAPGHGKSTALARLAAQASLAQAPVLIVTMDTGKAGAVTQIETYASLLKARVAIAEDEQALKAAVDGAPTGSAIFVDTPGANIWDATERSIMRRWIEAAGAEPVWIYAAGGDPDDAADCAKLYAGMGIRRVIATKCDLARRLGALIALAHAGPVSLSHFVSSPYLSEGFAAATHAALATKTLSISALDTCDPDKHSQEAQRA